MSYLYRLKKNKLDSDIVKSNSRLYTSSDAQLGAAQPDHELSLQIKSAIYGIQILTAHNES